MLKYKFVKSSTDWKMCPEPNLPEVALFGRSNVGKSSLINALLQAKGAAKTSATPGKTQVINHFIINSSWYLVDLPGYGYAKVSKVERSKWEKMIKNYLVNRTNLMALLLLVDSRIPPQKSDLEFAFFAGKNNLPLYIVFTKADKQSVAKTRATVEAFSQSMLETWDELPPMIISSSVSGLGREEVLAVMEGALDAFQPGQ